jgi:hypothetical protein
VRDAVGSWLARGPHGIRDGLLFFFVLFVLRVLLRSPWFGAIAFTILFTIPLVLNDNPLVNAIAGVAIYGLAALVVIRFGLLALTVACCVAGVIGPPVSLHTDAWYFGNVALLFASGIAVAVWSAWIATGSRRFRAVDLFG